MKKESKGLIVVSIVILLVIAGLWLRWLFQDKGTVTIPEASGDALYGFEVSEDIASSIKKEETVLNTSFIQEELQNVGFLVTQEYDFTLKEDDTKYITYFDLVKTESSFAFLYDGTVAAGVDFGEISVILNESQKKIVITIPEAQTRYVTIDYDSFELISEEGHFWNRANMEDYNTAMADLQNKARDKAIERGILDKAEKNAQILIQTMVEELVNENEYEIYLNQK